MSQAANHGIDTAVNAGSDAVTGAIVSAGQGVQRAGGWAAEQAANARAWLAGCDWTKIAVGVAIAGAAVVPFALGGYLVLAGVGLTAEATTAAAIYEGLEITAYGSVTAVVGGGGGFAVGGYIAAQADGGAHRNGSGHHGKE